MNERLIPKSADVAYDRLVRALSALQNDPVRQPSFGEYISVIQRVIGFLTHARYSDARPMLLQAAASLEGARTLGPIRLRAASNIEIDISALLEEAMELMATAIRETEPRISSQPATDHAPSLPSPEPPKRPSKARRPSSGSSAKQPPKRPTVFPRTAVRPRLGSTGLPRILAELAAHSESNFFTRIGETVREHGGIFAATWVAVAINTPCEVDLLFPGELEATVQGIVRWRRVSSDGNPDSAPGLGIEITHADSEAWALIERYVRKRDPIIHDM